MKKRTIREKVIRLMAEQPKLSPKEIAKKLNVNPQYVHTIKWQNKRNSNFVSKVFEKAGLKKEGKYLAPKRIVGKLTMEQLKEENSNKSPSQRLLEALANTPADLVNKPPHYTAGGIDFLDYAEAKGLTENAYLFNVVKYVSRAGKKVGSDPLEDLKKAEFYLKREIAQRERA